MGCFLGCFGFPKKKRKRRKPHNKPPSGDQKHGSYVPLDSDFNLKLDITERSIISDSKQRDEDKEELSTRVKKKVTFNLNVKTYEPIPNDDYDAFFCDTNWGENREETAKSGSAPLQYEEDVFASKTGEFPSGHRYQNCGESYDEEDYIKLEESDLEDDEDEEDCFEDDESDRETTQVQFLDQFHSSSMESEKKFAFTSAAEEQTRHQEMKIVESNSNARDRSRCAYSVLNPVENLTQWKAIKAKTAPPLSLQLQRKENVVASREQKMPLGLKPDFSHKLQLNHSKPSLIQDKAVDSSFSNWLISSETEPITKSSTTAVIAI